jgi:ribosomal protein L37E
MSEDEEINKKEIEEGKKDSSCPRCGLRSYDNVCQNCGTPIVDNTDDEEEDYNWREKYR